MAKGQATTVTTQPIDQEHAATFADLFDAIVANVATVVHGKDHVIRLALTSLLAQGHLLLEDVPGVGKTSLAKALAASVGARFGRVQFTPDLLPSDVIGTSVWNQHDGSFEFRPGPIFAQVLLGDEINRASPKTQSALLEAMAERQVTVDGATHGLGRPFLVIATQNPAEHQGTFPLPESQLDRFLMKLSIGYPNQAVEAALLVDPDSAVPAENLQAVSDPSAVNALVGAAATVHVADSIAGYVVEIADRSRRSPLLTLGVSPRAALGLLAAARVWAAAQGRRFVLPDDVRELAVPVLAHRVAISAEGRLSGLSAEEVIADIVGAVPVPR